MFMVIELKRSSFGCNKMAFLHTKNFNKFVKIYIMKSVLIMVMIVTVFIETILLIRFIGQIFVINVKCSNYQKDVK